jgi:hypothetical protein
MSDIDLSAMYNAAEPEEVEREQNVPEIIDRVQGVNMTSTRTRRHITVKVGQDQVTLPSPQFVYDVELLAKRSERAISTLTTTVNRLIAENKRINAELNSLRKELAGKVDYVR